MHIMLLYSFMTQEPGAARLLQLIGVHLLAVSPDPLKIIEEAVLLAENMHDHIAEIEKDPFRMIISFHLFENSTGLFHFLAHFIRQSLDLWTAANKNQSLLTNYKASKQYKSIHLTDLRKSGRGKKKHGKK